MKNANKKHNYFYFRQVLKFYKKHIKFYIGFCAILVFRVAISFFSAMFTANIITSLMEGDFRWAFNWALILLGAQIFDQLIAWLNTYFYKNLQNNVKFDLQQAIVASALNMKMSVYDTIGSGVIVTRLTSDIDHLSDRFKSLTEYIMKIIKRVAYLVYLVVLNVPLGLMVIGSVVFVSLCYAVRTYYLKKLKPGVRKQREVVSSRIIETIRAIKDVKTLNCEENILGMLDKEQRQYIRLDNKEWYIGSGLCKLTDALIHVFDFCFIILSMFLMVKFDLSYAIFYTCYLYKGHTFTLATDFGEFRYKLAECEIYAQRLNAILFPQKDNVDSFGEEEVVKYSGKIEFKNVSFSYIDNIPVLDNISFKISPKSTVGIVGESGCGKSTIASLIAHLYYKQDGQILFDGKDVDALSRDFVKENIAVVNQFPYLFNLSVRENFKMISSSISDEEIWSLCDKVEIKEYLETLPKGLDSVIGEGGCQLSGGQRQKLCIARALCRDVKVLIFDEATSSLDNSSQKEIMAVIEKLKSKLTIIMIAHRLSTITYADDILLIKKGKLVSQGTHEQLMEKSAYYRKLYSKSN